jgi:hypothetical protein
MSHLAPIPARPAPDSNALDLPDTRVTRMRRAVIRACEDHGLPLAEPENRIVPVQGASFATAMARALETL